MTFQDMISKIINKKRNFSYLDNLINHSNKNEIMLDSDIVSSTSDELSYREGIEIKRDGLVIDGRGHTIDAMTNGRIFKIKDKTVTFKNITFTHGISLPHDSSFESVFNSTIGGGAVYAAGCRLSFINCRFDENVNNRGSAIFLGYSQTVIEDCEFINNSASEFGGAIFNDDDSTLTIINSKFTDNTGSHHGGTIENIESSLNMIGCEVSNQSLDKSAIVTGTSGNIVLRDCSFNNADIVVKNIGISKNCRFNDSTITIYPSGDLYYLESDRDTISFEGDNAHYFDEDKDRIKELSMYEMAVEFVKFFPRFEGADFKEQDLIHNEMVEFVEIWERMCSWETNFVMAKIIVGIHELSLDEIEENYMHLINKEVAMDPAQFDTLHEIFEEVMKLKEIPPKSFNELEKLIKSNDESVSFTSDFILEDSEAADFADGLKIDADDLVIDGKGHVIDAKGKVQIFRIDAKNVTFKDITFKNGFGNMGGAISNIGNVEFTNCRFIGNVASELGGAIVNDERMVIDNCQFIDNASGGVGGAIAATYVSNLEIRNTKFIENRVSFDVDCPGDVLPADAQGFGGAIYNNGKLRLGECVFDKNSADRCGGAMIILPESKIDINDVEFKSNTAKLDGGVIYNMGEVEFKNARFSNNSAENSASAIYALDSSKIRIANSEFDNNDSNVNVIVNNGKLELINSTINQGDIDGEGELSVSDNALPDNI